MPSAEEEGDEYYRPANWIEIGAEPVPPVGGPPMAPGTTEREPDEEDAPAESGAMTDILRAMVTSVVTKDLQIERDRVVQRVGMQGANFVSAVDAFYLSWTSATAAGLTDADARIAIMSHANESKRQLLDTAGVSTTGSLKANVLDLVSTWDSRGQQLIAQLMKAVQK